LGHQREERLRGRLRGGEHERALPEVVDDERRHRHGAPGDADGRFPKVPHVGIERFAARHRQDDGTEHQDAVYAMGEQEPPRMMRRECTEDLRVLGNLPGAEDTDGRKPDDHHGPEQSTDGVCPSFLHEEEGEQDAAGQRHDGGLELRAEHAEALHRTEHRNRRRDGPVAVEECRPHDDEERHARNAVPARGPQRVRHEREQRKDAAFAVVIRSHDECQVLHRDDHGKRPDD
jgi:hypothetical protein